MGFLGVQLLKHSELQDSSRGTALVHRSAAIVVLVIIVLIKEAGLSEPGLLLPLQLLLPQHRPLPGLRCLEKNSSILELVHDRSDATAIALVAIADNLTANDDRRRRLSLADTEADRPGTH
jgi:hypothetical protein